MIGQATDGDERMIVGRRLPRPEAPAQVRGVSSSAAELSLPGQLHVVVVRSPHPHARIVRVEVASAKAVAGVRAVLTSAQLPGRDRVPFLQQDWPLLAGEYVRHAGEPVAIVAAESLRAAEKAADLVAVEYEPLDALLDVDEALRAGEIIFQQRIRRGEAAVALDRSDVVSIEGVFRTP